MSELRDRTVLRFLAQPTDVNYGGKVHGGNVMHWIDQAAYACATGWSRGYCVTAFLGDTQFLRPIHIGDMVEVRARIAHTGRSSMHISVNVHSKGIEQDDFTHTTHCFAVFVCVDRDGRAVPVPKFEAADEEGKALEEYAREMQHARDEIRAGKERLQLTV